MSGAEPCTGSNMAGTPPSGLTFMLAASPMPPWIAAPMSVSTSMNRFDPTTTSNISGRVTKSAAAASTRTRSSATDGWSAATSATTSSQKVKAWRPALDFVMLATRPRRLSARSNAYRTTRSTPARVKTSVWIATSPGRPRWTDRPPGVLALGVLADAHHVDLLGALVAQRADDPRHQPHRPQVDVLVEDLADRQQQTPQRHVVRHLRRADRAEVDRVKAPQHIQRIFGHHQPMLAVVVAAPRELGQIQREAGGGLLCGGEHPQPGLHDLAAGPIAGITAIR